jgi:hypothetical protein
LEDRQTLTRRWTQSKQPELLAPGILDNLNGSGSMDYSLINRGKEMGTWTWSIRDC